MKTTFKYEKRIWKKGYNKIAGLDESGRGPLAGPVVAAAFMITDTSKVDRIKRIGNIKGSKQLTAKRREWFYKKLKDLDFVDWAVAKVFPVVIDRINIKNAAELAMERAVKKLNVRPDFLLIDGKFLKNKKLNKMNHKLVIKGDQKVFCCAAASIIAKVTRDRTMIRYSKKYPGYKFRRHKGYPTKLHRKRIKKFGTCKIHRKSFNLTVEKSRKA